MKLDLKALQDALKTRIGGVIYIRIYADGSGSASHTGDFNCPDSQHFTRNFEGLDKALKNTVSREPEKLFVVE